MGLNLNEYIKPHMEEPAIARAYLMRYRVPEYA